jgi:leucyl aminopeptidase (aminopeptidase T)
MDEEKLISGASEAVQTCMRIREGEECLVITDEETWNVAKYVIEEISSITDYLEVFKISAEESRPFRAPDSLLEKVAEADAVFSIADYVYGEIPTFYRPIQEAVEFSDTRMAVMVEMDEQILSEGINADYERIRELSEKVYDEVVDVEEIQVTTEKGTDLEVKFGHKWAILDGFPEEGSWTNLPDGEVLTAPKNVNGQIVIDGTTEFLGKVEDSPVSVEIEDGRAVEGSIECEDEKKAERFRELLFETDENSDRVGEFAIGTNIFLEELCGNLTQDEKFPSIHIAFGDPHGSLTGAEWESDLHMDAVILKPKVIADGKILMEEGKFKI